MDSSATIEMNYYPLTQVVIDNAPPLTGSILNKTQEGGQYPIVNMTPTAVEETNITPGSNGTLISGGTLESLNYVNDQSGFRLDTTGTGYFAGGIIQLGNLKGIATFTTDTFGIFIGNYSSGKYLSYDTASGNLVINGYVQSTKGSFGGDGSDGALSISSGTTTVDCANAQVVVKNYTSISITGTGVLAFSNPHANGTYIILKSQGAVTLTSSATPMIDAKGMGAAGGASSVGAGNSGTSGYAPFFQTNFGVGGTAGGAGNGGAIPTFLYNSMSQVLSRYPQAFVGAGGGSGYSIDASASGAGGRGGGALIIECAGAWNFTTASGISVNGAVGGQGSSPSLAASGGGGGGGYFLGLYNTLTANSGSVTKSGGAGGTNSGNANSGGAGASAINAGTAGGGGTGGTGGDGISNIIQNTLYS